MSRKRRERFRPRVSSRLLSASEINILKEADRMVRLAQAQDARLVRLNQFVLFSTESGDAWLLDTEDQLALRLARDGQKQPYFITDTPTQFAIEWKYTYGIREGVFVVADQSGRTLAITGYPTDEILKHSVRTP